MAEILRSEPKEPNVQELQTYIDTLCTRLFTERIFEHTHSDQLNYEVDVALEEIAQKAGMLLTQAREVTVRQVLDKAYRQLIQLQTPEQVAIQSTLTEFFSGTHNLFALLPIDHQIQIASSALTHDELSSVRAVMQANIVECLSRGTVSKETIALLTHTVEQSDAIPALQQVHLYENLFAETRAPGYDASTAKDTIRAVLTNVQQESPYPFVRFAAAAGATHIINDAPHEFHRRQTGEIDHRTTDGSVAIARHSSGRLDERGLLTHIALDQQQQVSHMLPLSAALHDSRLLPFHHQLPLDHATQIMQQLYRPDMRRIIEQYLGAPLTELSFRAQMQLASYLLENDDIHMLDRIQAIGQNEAINTPAALELFFAASVNTVHAQRIVDFCESAQPSAVNTVAQAYTHILDTLETIEEDIAEAFALPPRSIAVDTRAVVQRFMVRANGILFSHMDVAQNDPTQLTAALEDVRTNMLGFASIMETVLRDYPEVGIEDIHNVEYQESRADALPEALQAAIVALVAQNFANQPGIAEYLRTCFSAQTPEAQQWRATTTFSVLTRTVPGNETPQLLACIHDRDINDVSITEPTKELGSLNVINEVKSAKIGSRMLSRKIVQLNTTHTLIARALPETRVGTAYVEDFGFDIDALLDDPKTTNGGFGMRIDRGALAEGAKRDMLRTLSPEALSERIINDDVVHHIGDETIVVAYSSTTHQQEALATARLLLNEHHYRLVRYRCLDGACDKRVYGYEKRTA